MENKPNNGGMMEVGVKTQPEFDPYAPPSPDQMKRQWKDTYDNRPIKYQKEYDRNRRQAIKEILQEQVKQSVKPSDRLNTVFQKQISK